MTSAAGPFASTQHTPPFQGSRSDDPESLRSDEGAVQHAIDLALEAMNQVAEAQAKLVADNNGSMPDRSVVLLGKSGSGKTTLVYALAGRTLNVTFDPATNLTALQPAEPMQGFVIGETKGSETSIPRMCLCTDHATDGTRMSVIDFPGFFETRGTVREIANAVCMQKVFSACPNTKLVILAGVEDLTSPAGKDFSSSIAVVSQTFSGDIEKIASAASLVVTRVGEESEEDLRSQIDQVIKGIPLNEAQKKLFEALKGRIAVFRAPVDPSPRSFDVGATVAAVFANVHKCAFAHNPKVTVALSEKAAKEALEAHNVLVSSVNRAVRAIMESAISSATTFVRRSVADLNATDRTKLCDEDRKLQGLLTRIDKVSGEIRAMVTDWTEIIQECGGESVVRGAIEKMMRELELAQVLKQWVGGERAVLFDGVEHMMQQALGVRRIVEDARSTIALSRASKEAEQEKARKETAEADVKKKKDEAPSEGWATACKIVGGLSEIVGTLAENTLGVTKEYVGLQTARLASEQEKMKLGVTSLALIPGLSCQLDAMIKQVDTMIKQTEDFSPKEGSVQPKGNADPQKK